MTAVILPKHYARRVTDVGYTLWTPGAMRHVVAAVAGLTLAVETDRQTGHTEIGVKLTAYDPWDNRVTVERTLSDGTPQSTRYTLASIGIILPLDEPFPGTPARFTGPRAYSDEQSAALALVRQERPEVRDWYVSWEMTPQGFDGDVAVAGKPAGALPPECEDTPSYASYRVNVKTGTVHVGYVSPVPAAAR